MKSDKSNQMFLGGVDATTGEVLQTPVLDVKLGSPSSETAPYPSGDTDFGVLDSSAVKQAHERLITTLQQFSEKLGQFLERAVDNATSLEVKTYVSDKLEDVKYEKGQFTGEVKLRALTRVNLDGDSLVCVPEQGGEIDGALWKIHADMVERALTNRAELIKAAASAATGLLDSLKGS